jgi:hypothetical protein
MFGVLHADGSGEDDPPIESLSRLYHELAETTAEHGDVSVIHDDTGWCVSAHRDGRVVLVNLGRRGEARHMSSVPKDGVLRLWRALIDGQIEAVLAEPWNPGHGT